MPGKQHADLLHASRPESSMYGHTDLVKRQSNVMQANALHKHKEQNNPVYKQDKMQESRKESYG